MTGWDSLSTSEKVSEVIEAVYVFAVCVFAVCVFAVCVFAVPSLMLFIGVALQP